MWSLGRSLACLTLVGCGMSPSGEGSASSLDGGATSPPTPKSAAPSAVVSADVTPRAPTWSASRGAGDTYVEVEMRGVARVSAEGHVALLTGYEDLVRGADGRVYVNHTREHTIGRLEGNEFIEVGRYGDLSPNALRAYDVAANGSIVGITGQEVFIIGRKGPGERITRAAMGSSDQDSATYFIDVLATNDIVYVSTSSELFVRSKTGGTRVIRAAPRSTFDEVYTFGGKPAVTAYADNAYRAHFIEGTRLVDVGLDTRYARHHSFAGKSSEAFSEMFVDVVRRKHDGTVERWNLNPDLMGDPVTAVDVDAQGRVWVGSTTGLHLLDGRSKRSFVPTGFYPELSGRVLAIASEGEGGSLPPWVARRTAREVHGTVTLARRPLPAVSVAMCAHPVNPDFIDRCKGAPNTFRSTSDAEGRFRFEDVPLGRYNVVVEGEAYGRLIMPVFVKDADSVVDMKALNQDLPR